MELKKDPRCYTDVCVNGKWFHHDHLTKSAYMLNGSQSIAIELVKTPETEDELINLLQGYC
ncbi:hypothetical protein GCM10007894_08770 [Paraferrimonas haliotis]|uniref:Uncharacterized protein n=1 Tax=Paraferrimonas haliotis TaxID=2013866 RepID=A0AA37TUC7_9GAMM|nr:hypothetical protein [Paraferrimonas haliotis]GLS82900.1 hypothetical protein GCM10007894_08770 [Paraferrimonas haliotis]